MWRTLAVGTPWPGTYNYNHPVYPERVTFWDLVRRKNTWIKEKSEISTREMTTAPLRPISQQKLFHSLNNLSAWKDHPLSARIWLLSSFATSSTQSSSKVQAQICNPLIPTMNNLHSCSSLPCSCHLSVCLTAHMSRQSTHTHALLETISTDTHTVEYQ